jgi:formate dehydrogenase major subunit
MRAGSLFNLCMITGKLGKHQADLFLLKKKTMLRVLFDTGLKNFDDRQLFLLKQGMVKNAFIFGEDPLGCAKDKETMADILSKINFTVVQDYFMSDTAFTADLILPASLPIETGGSYTNSQKFIQQFTQGLEPKTKPAFIQLAELLGMLGVQIKAETIDDVMNERFSSLPLQKEKDLKFELTYTEADNYARMFNHGCDYLVKRFDDEFEAAFKKTESLKIITE